MDIRFLELYVNTLAPHSPELDISQEALAEDPLKSHHPGCLGPETFRHILSKSLCLGWFLALEWAVNANHHPKQPLPKLLWCPLAPHSHNGGGSDVTCQVCSKPSVWQLCCYFCMDRYISLFEAPLMCCPSCTGRIPGRSLNTTLDTCTCPAPGTELLTRGMWYPAGIGSAELFHKRPQLSISMATSRRCCRSDRRCVLHCSFPAGTRAQTEWPGEKIHFIVAKRPFGYYLSKSLGTVIYHW